MSFIKSINKFVLSQNKDKQLLTPGPASLASENLINLKPCFGRGDKEYKNIENKVLSMLKKISGHKHIARLQGSASLALEILVANFFSGKIDLTNLPNQLEILKLDINQFTVNIDTEYMTIISISMDH